MEFIKKHKVIIIVLTIILVLIVTALLLLKVFMVDSSKDLYGNRLEGIGNVLVADASVSKMKEEIKALEEVSDITYRLQGRLIYITLTVKDSVVVDTSKEIALKTLDYFTDKEKAFYDIQVIIKNENTEMEGYPKIGYKHKTSENLVF